MREKISRVILSALIAISLFVMCGSARLTVPSMTEKLPSEVYERYTQEQTILEPKVNYYSDSIRILVTEEQKQKVQNKIKEMDEEIKIISKIIYREARGEGKDYQAAVVWTILNRVDAKGYGSTIKKVATAPNQYAWIPKTPLWDEHLELAEDVLVRYYLEKEGIEEVGRVIPNTYKFFAGDGVHNYFREEFKSKTYWDWSLPSPYED